MDTYDRRIQLGASRRRLEDAEALHKANRWAGAMYVGGYAVECALKSQICYRENKSSFKETSCFKNGVTGNSLHNLSLLLSYSPEIKRAISTDRSDTYKPSWKTIQSEWCKDELRYWDKQGVESKSTKFMGAVQVLHRFLLSQQGEAS